MDVNSSNKDLKTSHVDILCAGSCCNSIGIDQLLDPSFVSNLNTSCGHKIDLGNSQIRQALLDAWNINN